MLLRQSVSETVAEIEAGRVEAFAPVPVSANCGISERLGKGCDDQLEGVDQLGHVVMQRPMGCNDKRLGQIRSSISICPCFAMADRQSFAAGSS